MCLLKRKNGGLSSTIYNETRPPTQLSYIISYYSRPKFKDKEFLQQKYCVQGLSLAQIAGQISSSREAVRKGLIRAGITLRKHGQHHGHPAQPRFGVRVVRGQSEGHKGEHQVIEAVLKLRSKGLSLRDIATAMSRSQFYTKKRAKIWHPYMVSRILTNQKHSRTHTSDLT